MQSSEDPSELGDSVTFTATVSPDETTNGTPTGSVQFSIDGTAAGSLVALDSNGIAIFTTSVLSVGPTPSLRITSMPTAISIRAAQH